MYRSCRYLPPGKLLAQDLAERYKKTNPKLHQQAVSSDLLLVDAEELESPTFRTSSGSSTS